jgi:3-oxoacyl-(acyl-carrier-protein) synthase
MSYILAHSTLENIQWKDSQSFPEFRKATANMLMAVSVIKPIISRLKNISSVALVLGSNHGELETSKNFLRTLASTGVARPFLFQSSLHNATTGFVTLHYGIQGPSLTVSQSHFTGENVLRTALSLIQSGLHPLVIALTVDSLFTGMADGFREIYPQGIELSEGAGAILLASEAGMKDLDLKPLGTLNKIETYNERATPSFSENPIPYYESNAIEVFCRELDSLEPKFNLELLKPNGSRSSIQWSKL